MSVIHGANRHEAILFPERLDDSIAEEHPVRILLVNPQVPKFGCPRCLL